MKLGREMSVNPATYLKDELEGLLGTGSVMMR